MTGRIELAGPPERLPSGAVIGRGPGHECGPLCGGGEHAGVTYVDVGPEYDRALLLAWMREDYEDTGIAVLAIQPAEAPPETSPHNGQRVWPWLVRFRWLEETP